MLCGEIKYCKWFSNLGDPGRLETVAHNYQDLLIIAVFTIQLGVASCVSRVGFETARIRAPRGRCSAVESHRTLHVHGRLTGYYWDTHRCATLSNGSVKFSIRTHPLSGIEGRLWRIRKERTAPMNVHHVGGHDHVFYTNDTFRPRLQCPDFELPFSDNH